MGEELPLGLLFIFLLHVCVYVRRLSLPPLPVNLLTLFAAAVLLIPALTPVENKNQ